MSRRLQEYCEQFNTSLNTYSIVEIIHPTVTLLFLKDPIDEAKWVL